MCKPAAWGFILFSVCLSDDQFLVVWLVFFPLGLVAGERVGNMGLPWLLGWLLTVADWVWLPVLAVLNRHLPAKHFCFVDKRGFSCLHAGLH